MQKSSRIFYKQKGCASDGAPFLLMNLINFHGIFAGNINQFLNIHIFDPCQLLSNQEYVGRIISFPR